MVGGLSSVPLAQAREKAAAARQQLAAGRNPIEVRKAADRARQTAIAFGAFADALVEDLKHGLRSETPVWVIPGKRMKGGREHRVPLSARSLEILETVEKLKNSEYVFPGEKRGGRSRLHRFGRSSIGRMSQQACTAFAARFAIGRRVHGLPAGGCRSGAGAFGRRRDRAGLPPWRRPGEAPQAYALDIR